MALYELVREIPNLCRNNQMRDVFVSEVETKDPEAYVRAFVGGHIDALTVQPGNGGAVTVLVKSGDVLQKFLFSPI